MLKKWDGRESAKEGGDSLIDGAWLQSDHFKLLLRILIQSLTNAGDEKERVKAMVED